MNKQSLFQKLGIILRDTEILMREFEHERDQSLDALQFEGAEAVLKDFYKKALTSIYRMRNNAAALLLRNDCSCKDRENSVSIFIDEVECQIPKQALKNILQKDYETVLGRNTSMELDTIGIINKESNESKDQKVPDKCTESEKEIKAVKSPMGTNEEKIQTPEIEGSETLEDGFEEFFENEEFFVGMDSSKEKGASGEKDTRQKETGKERATEQVKEETHTNDGQTEDAFGFEDEFFFDDENIGAEDHTKNHSEDGKQAQKPETDPKINHEDDDFEFWMDSTETAESHDHMSEEKKDDAGKEQIKELDEEGQVKTNATKPDHVSSNKNSEPDDDDFFFFDDDDLIKKEQDKGQPDQAPKEKKQEVFTKPEKDHKSLSSPIHEDDPDDDDFGFFSSFDKETERKQKEEKPNTGLFRPNVISFETKKIQTKEQKESLVKPKFTAEASDDDPDVIMKKLREARTEYDRAVVEKKIIDEQSGKDLKGMVFDMSTGGKKKGTVNAKEAAEKIDRVAESLIQTSRKDKILDMQMSTDPASGSYTYQIQKESDYTRNLKDFILDIYKLKISISNEDGSIVHEEMAKMVVAPITIPSTGSNFGTDICAYLECNEEEHGVVVLPGGKKTIAIRCDDYSVFVRGSWENGEFLSTISVVGNGNHIEHKLAKKKLRPSSMDGIGIGHNVIVLDHATTVHIIPTVFKNTKYENTDFMGVVVKDYGIDQDAECMITKEEADIMVKGEKLKYTISCKWDEEKNLLVDQKINR